MHKPILASASPARKLMLENAGIACEVAAALMDEEAEKSRLGQLAPKSLARKLAALKAESLKAIHPQRLIIGADQTLEFRGHVISKPRSFEEACAQLLSMRGKSHLLHSAAACIERGSHTWSACGTARLKMRNFSDAFLERYLALLGDEVFTTVGGYRIEGLGAQLFDEIEGDYHVILGLPLLPLLKFLRSRGVILA